jgi:hypothetical protein
VVVLRVIALAYLRRAIAQCTDDGYRGLLISRSKSATGRFMVFE